MQTQTPQSSYTGPVFYARSDRHSDRYYVVRENAATGFYACECPDHQHRERDCKHIKRVQAGEITAAQPKRPAPALLPAFTRARTSAEGLAFASSLDV
jgi:hypothetical protein